MGFSSLRKFLPKIHFASGRLGVHRFTTDNIFFSSGEKFLIKDHDGGIEKYDEGTMLPPPYDSTRFYNMILYTPISTNIDSASYLILYKLFFYKFLKICSNSFGKPLRPRLEQVNIQNWSTTH